MGRDDLVARILSDAQASAEETVRAARARAEEILAAAEAQCKREREETEREAEEQGKRIRDGKAAMARLDSAKIRLAERRRVLDAVYLRALAALLCLERREAVSLSERLLREYAEEGDEIVFSKEFPYCGEVAKLSVAVQKKLTVSEERPDLGGGFVLRGKTSDKDVSYRALLAADREAHQAEIARALFGDH